MFATARVRALLVTAAEAAVSICAVPPTPAAASTASAADRAYVRLLARVDPRSTVKATAWAALISSTVDAATARFFASDFDFARRVLETVALLRDHGPGKQMRTAATFALRPAANWRQVAQAASSATGLNWEAVASTAGATAETWAAERQNAAEQAAYWESLYAEALAGELAMTGGAR